MKEIILATKKWNYGSYIASYSEGEISKLLLHSYADNLRFSAINAFNAII